MDNFIDIDLYKKIVESVPIMSVDVVVFNENLTKTLLFLRNNEPCKGEYYTLGGRLNKNESILDCAKRKLIDEIGLDVKESELVQIGFVEEKFNNSFYSEEVSSHFVNVVYALVINDTHEITLDKQHSSFKWFDVSDKTMYKFVYRKIQMSYNLLSKK